MEEPQQTSPPPIPNRTPPPIPQKRGQTAPPPIPKAKSRELRLRRPPKGVEFQLYTDGFESELTEGNYISSAAWLTASALIGFGIATAIGSGPFFWGFIALGAFGVYRGFRHAIGELRIRYRRGRIEIRQGLLGLRQSKNISVEVQDIRTIQLTRRSNSLRASGKISGESIVLATTNEKYSFGQDLKKSDRDYLYNVLVYFLDKEMRRISS